MPDSIDWPSSSRRRPRLLLFAIPLILLVLFSGTLLSYYVDSLWFASLNFSEIFWKTLALKWGVFAGVAAATFLILYGIFLALKQVHRYDLPETREVVFNRQPVTIPVGPLLRWLGFGVSGVVAFVSGLRIAAEWPTLARYWYAPAPTSGTLDPILGRPLNFYLFSLPFWSLVGDWLATIAFLSLGFAVFFLFIASGSRALDGQRDLRLTPSWRGISFTASFFLLVLAVQVYISRFEQIFGEHTVLSGATYIDAHVFLKGMLIVSAALVLGAGIAAVNAFTGAGRRQLVWSILPAVLCFLLLQVFGWYVNSFIVKPNELVREQPYIGYNIEFTRKAFGLDRITQREFPAQTTVESADAANNQGTLKNIRLWDWRALQDTLRQIQEIRTYYDFPDVDIDRYDFNGAVHQVMIAARELNIEKLPESSRNWINEKLIYTHGYGVTMNPVNGFTSEGLPTLLLGNMPIQSTVPGLNVTRPEIYFGELTNSDVYVKTGQKEFNYPQGQANSLTSYEGTGGIVLGGRLRRLLIALDRGDLAKLPFSDDISPDSRLLMRRNVIARATALAPFLTLDPDPYIVVGDDGRLSWIIDAFTTADTSPYSRHYTFEGNTINYARNSVKIVIDAYDGTTSFYVFDSEDPILASYRNMFPNLFKDASAMPPALHKHVRYSEQLLKLQAEVYGLYHMTDPEMFYNREDLWTLATESSVDDQAQRTTQPVAPNFVLMKLPGETGVEYVNILPFTPSNRNNLIGWIAGRSDGAHYGSAVVYNFPKTRLVDGPLQVEARIDQNAELSGQLTLWNQQGSHVRRGSLLVIPTGNALLYAEAIYLQAERSPMPELRLVVLALQDRLAYGPTFEAAMHSLFDGAPSSTSGVQAPLADAQPGAQPEVTLQPAPHGDRNARISEAAKDLADYQRLTAEGKLSAAGEKLEQLKRVLEDLTAHQQ